MSEAISMPLLAGYKFMLEIHLRQCRFVFSACGPFIKNKERIQKFKETERPPDFNMIWLMEILRIYLEEQLLVM